MRVIELSNTPITACVFALAISKIYTSTLSVLYTYKVLLNIHNIYSDNLRGQRLYSQKLRIEVSGYNEFKMVKISIFIIRIKKYNNVWLDTQNYS